MKSKVILKSVAKMGRSYKSGWPRKLFMYSNQNDDVQYREFLVSVREQEL